ncbi:glycoside hydrolase family 130 protein [Adhaeretor mobilis]|nr:glycoside hydrolase family 130 protein [Adhaeretor mobilis]
MSNNVINLKRTGTVLKPDQSRVLLRPFSPGDSQRTNRIITRIMALPEEQVGHLLDEVTAEFSQRHREIRRMFLERFEQVRQEHDPKGGLSEERRLLIGSYFLAEYTLESAALFNPSIVMHPDQAGLPPGALRFTLSLRATGEGHISSITFRTGIIHSNNQIEVLDAAGYLSEPRQIPNPAYEKGLFTRKLRELGFKSEFTGRVIDKLGDSFDMQELRAALDAELDQERHSQGVLQEDQNTAHGIWMLAQSNYEVQFQPEQQLSERILFPATPSQSNGIEDARFVRFQNDDGSYIYYATFTAFDGNVVMPELVETVDFLRFRFTTLNGPAAQNKGMAMFPRKIDGHYAMLARQDNESIYLSYSDNVHFWNERQVLLRPTFSWELIQIGNCGSPIETDAGWLVLSHGVGPLRKYCIGAFLLDRDDPSKVIGRLRAPLIQPNENEREGYVPNVVYTCGALLHKSELIIPYGLADHATGFATVPVEDVLAAME